MKLSQPIIKTLNERGPLTLPQLKEYLRDIGVTAALDKLRNTLSYLTSKGLIEKQEKICVGHHKYEPATYQINEDS